MIRHTGNPQNFERNYRNLDERDEIVQNEERFLFS